MFGGLQQALRRVVSGDKRRFDDGEYNLDLTYITERIIGLPIKATLNQKCTN